MQSDVVTVSGNRSSGCFLKVSCFHSIQNARHARFSCKIMVFRTAVENQFLAITQGSQSAT